MALFKPYKINPFVNLYFALQKCNYTKYVTEFDIKKSYDILGIPEDSDQEKIRSKYLELVKKFHPDSGAPEANSEQFLRIDKAFRILLTKKSKERWCSESVNFEIHAQEFDIKHTAPQHRQYLTYDGMGSGNPSEREKQYSKIRAIHAADSVMTHRVNKAMADEKTLMEKKPQKHKIKTKYGYERLVEDLIQEAMSKGEFSNLSGTGKPLKGHQNSNPYVDFVTHKLNQVLIENGFTPEWIMLQKEIREEKKKLVDKLYSERKELGDYPFTDAVHEYKWKRVLDDSVKLVSEINKKIEKYNLVVPILQKQILLINFKKLADTVLQKGESNQKEINTKIAALQEAKDNPKNILGLIESFFIK